MIYGNGKDSLKKPIQIEPDIDGATLTDIALISDCAVLLISGKPVPFVYQPKENLTGKYPPQLTPVDKGKGKNYMQLDIDDRITIDRLASNGTTHFAALAGNTAYWFKYVGGGNFIKLRQTLEMPCLDIALGETKVILLQGGPKNLMVRVIPLDSLESEGSTYPLKANRDTAKLVGNDTPMLIAYDKLGNGKGAAIKNGKVAPVSVL